MSAYSDYALARIAAAGGGAYWGSGTSDQSGNGHGLTAQGGVTPGGFASSSIVGESQSTDFDGVDDRFSSSYAPFGAGTALTLFGWFDLDDLATQLVIFGSDGSAPLYLRHNNASGDITFTPNRTAANPAATWAATNWTASGFRFVALTFNEPGDVAEFFLDAVSQGTKAVATAYGTVGNLQIGWDGFASRFNGRGTGLGLVQGVLSATEIANLYALAANGSATATTSAASSVTNATADLNGTVDPNGISTDYHFEYGPTVAYGSSTSTANAGSGTSPVPVTTSIGGLSQNTTYHFRLVATNATGTFAGSDQTFTTPAGPVLFTFSPGILAVFPEGTLVGLYSPTYMSGFPSPDPKRPTTDRRDSPPLEQALATATVTNGQLTFTVPTPGLYYAAAEVSPGIWRSRAFQA